MNRLMVVPFAVLIALILTAFLNPIQPVTGERSSSTSPVVLLKLASAGFACLVGFWGLLQSPRVRRVLSGTAGLALCTLAVLFLGTSLVAYGDSANISRASALILVSYLVFAATSLATVGLRTMLGACLAGQTLFLCLAWCVYLLFPSFGQFQEYTGEETTVSRMGGVAHPNAIGREAAVLVLLALSALRAGMLRERRRLRPLIFGGILTLAAMTLVMTISRTSMLASAAGVAMLFFDRLYSRRGVMLGLAGMVVLLSGFLVSALTSPDSVADSVTRSLTKSGDVSELTSLTGRTRIWAEAIDWIGRRPLTGYGLDSAASVMSKESVGTHNLLLHVTFSGGLMAGGVLLILLGATLYLAMTSHNPLTRALMTFVLVAGLVEDTLFPSFPCALTLLWMSLLLSAAPRVRSSEASPESSGGG
ncbi:MAG: O-antigen ligase family protein [Planctomycetota bacterium]